MKELFKKYWYVLIGVIVLMFTYFTLNFNDTSEVKLQDTIESLEVELEKENESVSEEKVSYYIDIKGEVAKPGVYEISKDGRIIDVINKAGGLTKNADTSLLNLSKKVVDEMSIRVYSKKEVNAAKESINKEPEIIEIIKEIEKECVCPEVNNTCDIKNDALVEIDKIEPVIKQESSNVSSESTNKKEESSNTSGESTDKKEESSDVGSESTNKKEESNNVNSESTSNKEENKLVNINIASKEELMSIPNIGESKANGIIEYRNKSKFEKIEDILNVSGIGAGVFEKIKKYITV